MATGNLYVMDLLSDVTFAQKSINASLSHQVTLSCVFFSFHGEPGAGLGGNASKTTIYVADMG
jgi:hypothetical protein